MARGSWILLLGICANLHAAMPIRDEALRRQMLAAVFPKAQVSVILGKLHPANRRKPGELIFFPDAMAGEKVYRVVGASSGDKEDCASDDVATRRKSDTRELSFVAYRWPQRPDLLAVLQYKFTGIGPAGACWSIGRIVHLAKRSTDWSVIEDIELDAQHHGGFERIELADLGGDGSDQLLVESDWGGAASAGSSLHIYSLNSGRFEPWLETIAAVTSPEGSSRQALDIPKTRAKKAREFCFVRTDFAGPDFRAYRRPRVTRPCYPRGTLYEPSTRLPK